MNERKILFFILSLFFYCIYCINMWFMAYNNKEVIIDENVEAAKNEPEIIKQISNLKKNNEFVAEMKTKRIPLFLKDACSALEVFTKKPLTKQNMNKKENVKPENDTIAAIGITAFLIILIVNAIIDVLKVKEEERAKRKLNPSGERRYSLAEFANKKTLRRDSSKFSLQMFQIAETVTTDANNEKKTRRPYTRGQSINSYLSDKKSSGESSAPASVAETPAAEAKYLKRQSVAKLFGARPGPVLRRSSFPALPLNPDIQALMLGSRQTSVDSDEEPDGKVHRVRLIRRR